MIALALSFCPLLIINCLYPSEIVWSKIPDPRRAHITQANPKMIICFNDRGFKIQIDRIWSKHLWAHFFFIAFAFFLGTGAASDTVRFSAEDLGAAFGFGVDLAFAFGAGFNALQATQQQMKMGVWNLELSHYKIVKVEKNNRQWGLALLNTWFKLQSFLLQLTNRSRSFVFCSTLCTSHVGSSIEKHWKHVEEQIYQYGS